MHVRFTYLPPVFSQSSALVTVAEPAHPSSVRANTSASTTPTTPELHFMLSLPSTSTSSRPPPPSPPGLPGRALSLRGTAPRSSGDGPTRRKGDSLTRELLHPERLRDPSLFPWPPSRVLLHEQCRTVLAASSEQTLDPRRVYGSMDRP